MRPETRLPSAFEALTDLVGGRGRPWIFLDYDGTLTPIVLRPELAILAPTMRATLEELADLADVAIVTGRDVDDARALVGIQSVTIAGSHGFEALRPDGQRETFAGAESFLPALHAAEGELRQALNGIAGARIDRKRFAIAVHFRETPAEFHAAVIAAVSDVCGRTGLRLGHGKMVVELRPDVDWHKGRLVASLLARHAAGDMRDQARSAYLGDDITDEDAFEALAGLEPAGASVIVGERASGPTAARYALADIAGVQEWLEAVVDRLR